jgi:uncharacterized LabA/DUF88 family protein
MTSDNGERVSVFIDGSNLDRATIHSFHRRVSPQVVAKKLVGQRRLMRVYYYEAPLLRRVNATSFESQQAFFERLRTDPHFQIRLGYRTERDREFECSKCGEKNTIKTWEQKGVDSLLVLDIVSLATKNAYDVAVLIAGDQDFVETVLEVRMLGKIVENAFTNYAWANTLKKAADKLISLNREFLRNCWM